MPALIEWIRHTPVSWFVLNYRWVWPISESDSMRSASNSGLIRRVVTMAPRVESGHGRTTFHTNQDVDSGVSHGAGDMASKSL